MTNEIKTQAEATTLSQIQARMARLDEKERERIRNILWDKSIVI